MIDYKLAKELKDAGFPVQEHDDDGINLDYPFHITLSELIEACGEDFYCLMVPMQAHNFGTKRIWHASSLHKGLGMDGETPEEAVAKLWLELNKK